MLAHTHRFHGHGSLRFVYKHGQTVRSRNMSLRFTHNKNRVHSRFAVVVSKKVFKSAAKRNRIRRRLFEIIRLNWQDPAKVSDVVLTVYNPEVLLMPHEQLVQEITNLMTDANLKPSDPDATMVN